MVLRINLETLPNDFSEVIAESNADGTYIDGNGELQNNAAAGLDPGTGTIGEVTKSELVDIEELPFYSVESLEEVSVKAYEGVSFLSEVDLADTGRAYTLSIGGIDYQAYFPVDAALDVIDDQLVNVGSANITGILSADGSEDLNSWIRQYITLSPLYTSSGNTNAYRYGSRAYVTTYAAGTGNSLTSEQEYVRPVVVDQPKLGVDFSLFQILVVGLLFVLVLFDSLGGIFRR